MAIASVAAFASLSISIVAARGEPGSPRHRSSSRVIRRRTIRLAGRRPPSGSDQNDQWKTRRRPRGPGVRRLYDKAEWEEDDDDGVAPFHLEDDDATNAGSANSTGGIVYSDSAGAKEADPPPPKPRERPPPPPPPLTAGDAEDARGTTGAHKTFRERHRGGDGPPPAPGPADDERDDTVLDDLLRGFTFAAAFALLLACLYRCCCHACVRCGLVPDERVLEARWRRWQLRKKRTYRGGGRGTVDDEASLRRGGDVPPLDTREWGRWMAGRAELGDDGFYYAEGGDVWDPALTSEWEGDDGSPAVGSVGLPEVEMAAWEEGKDRAPSSDEMVLEYGEGDELEDQSHDSRMFDDEDGGRKMEREAEKFFEGKSRGEEEKTAKQVDGTGNDAAGNTGANDAATSNRHTLIDLDVTVEIDRSSDGSDDLFSDALQLPSGEKDETPLLDSLPGYNDSSQPAEDSVNEASRQAEDRPDDANDSQHSETEENGLEGSVNDSIITNADFPSSMIAAGDKGYDEETDLLGLRSDSPPPLDLEEIEKKAIENMKNDKLY